MPIRRSVLLILLTVLSAAETRQSWAGGMSAPDLPDPQAIVDACWTVSKDDRESKTSPRIRGGHAKTHRCLEREILDLHESLRFGNFGLNREKMAKELENLRKAVGALYHMIYYDNAACAPQCEPPDPALGQRRYAAMLERMIWNMILITADHTNQTEGLRKPRDSSFRAKYAPDHFAAFDAGSRESQQMVQACWAISLEDRSSINNPRQREGHLKTVLCLEEKVAALRRTLGFGGTTLSDEETREALEQIRTAIGRIYWMIGNHSDYCHPGCGTMWYTYHLPPTGSVFAELIHVMTDQAKAYGGNSPKRPAR